MFKCVRSTGKSLHDIVAERATLEQAINTYKFDHIVFKSMVSRSPTAKEVLFLNNPTWSSCLRPNHVRCMGFRLKPDLIDRNLTYENLREMRWSASDWVDAFGSLAPLYDRIIRPKMEFCGDKALSDLGWDVKTFEKSTREPKNPRRIVLRL